MKTDEHEQTRRKTGTDLALRAVDQCLNAYRRDLPEMLVDHQGEWVAYHGDQRVGFGQSKTKLYQHCLDQGWSSSTFIVLRVFPDVERVVDL